MMKQKLFLIGIIVSIFSHQLFSQQDSTKKYPGADIDVRLDKGDFMVGGTLGLNLKTAENENQLLQTALTEDRDKFNLRIDGAYALKDEWFVGLGFLWGVTNREGDYENSDGEISNIKLHSTSYSVRPFIKNHLPLGPSKRFNLVVQTELGFVIDQSIEETTTGDIVSRKLTDEWGFGLGVRPGLLAFVMKNFAVEASVNVAGIGFLVTDIKQTDEPDVSIRTAELDLKIDILQLNLGFITYF
ncbi:MAG: outer membrane beta-barrel protein [Bacteroidales bacterium]|nr:outer membrane beta-barrel protein [Bacteroidales bacterium]